MKKPKAILFDMDGTLLNSIEVVYAGVCFIFERSGQPVPSFLHYCQYYIPPFMEFYRDRNITAPKEQLFEWYHSVATHDKALLFEDTVSAIQILHKAKVLLGIVSAQRQEVLDDHCHKAEIAHLFDVIVGMSEEKAVEIKSFCQKHSLAASDVWYVGDFPYDMHQAKRAGVVAIGITRNHDTTEILKEAGADQCIQHLDELLRLVG